MFIEELFTIIDVDVELACSVIAACVVLHDIWESVLADMTEAMYRSVFCQGFVVLSRGTLDW